MDPFDEIISNAREHQEPAKPTAAAALIALLITVWMLTAASATLIWLMIRFS